MKKIIFSDTSIVKIDNIYNYILKNKLEKVAQKVIEQIHQTLENLLYFNSIGQEVIYENIKCRELFCLNYRIFYMVREKEIFIVTVLHTSLDSKREYEGDIKKYE